MKRALRWLVALTLVGAAVFWWITRPETAKAEVLAGLEPDLAAGEQVFYAGGCASCHSADKAEGEAKLLLTGGQGFPSPFGTFYAPNISPHPEQGIGALVGARSLQCDAPRHLARWRALLPGLSLRFLHQGDGSGYRVTARLLAIPARLGRRQQAA